MLRFSRMAVMAPSRTRGGVGKIADALAEVDAAHALAFAGHAADVGLDEVLDAVGGGEGHGGGEFC